MLLPYLNPDPAVAARLLVNCHVTKLGLECAQIAATAAGPRGGTMMIEILP